MSANTDTTAERLEPTFDVEEEIVAEVAARLDAGDTEPTAGAVRDRLYDVLEVRPEWRADGRPVAEAVREALRDTAE